MIQFPNWFIYYFFISGIIMCLIGFYDINFKDKDESLANKIADITWSTGVKREHVVAVLYLLLFLFGWVMLPYEIYTSIQEVFKGES